jgi:hypothetical protein
VTPYLLAKPLRIGVFDKALTTRIVDRLPNKIEASVRLKEIAYCAADRGQRNALVDRDVLWRDVLMVNNDTFRLASAQTGGSWYRKMNPMRIRVGDPVHGECSFMGNRHSLGAAVCLCPKHRFATLSETTWGKVGNPVYSSRHSLDLATLDEGAEEPSP